MATDEDCKKMDIQVDKGATVSKTQGREKQDKIVPRGENFALLCAKLICWEGGTLRKFAHVAVFPLQHQTKRRLPTKYVRQRLSWRNVLKLPNDQTERVCVDCGRSARSARPSSHGCDQVSAKNVVFSDLNLKGHRVGSLCHTHRALQCHRNLWGLARTLHSSSNPSYYWDDFRAEPSGPRKPRMPVVRMSVVVQGLSESALAAPPRRSLRPRRAAHKTSAWILSST